MFLFPLGECVALFKLSPYWVLVLGRGLGFGGSGIQSPPFIVIFPL